MSEVTFSVKDFEQFQHYKDRNPPWIKLYNTVLRDYKFAKMHDTMKWHLVGIWSLASQHNNRIPYDSAWIQQQIGAVEPVDIEALVQAGWLLLQHDSKPLAPRKQKARLVEAEGEKEKKDPPSPPQAGGSDAPQGEGKPEAPSRANGTNPRSVAKAKREAEESARLAEVRHAREAEEDMRWRPRLVEYSGTGKWQSTWGTAPSINPNITETGVLLPRRLWPEYREIHGQRSIREIPEMLRRVPDDEAAALAARYEHLTSERRTG